MGLSCQNFYEVSSTRNPQKRGGTGGGMGIKKLDFFSVADKKNTRLSSNFVH